MNHFKARGKVAIDYLQGLLHIIAWLEPALSEETGHTDNDELRCTANASVRTLSTTCLQAEDHVCAAVNALIACIGRNPETADENLEVLSSNVTICLTRNVCIDGWRGFQHLSFAGAETLCNMSSQRITKIKPLEDYVDLINVLTFSLDWFVLEWVFDGGSILEPALYGATMRVTLS
ncbi:hypothetical protein ARMSODRAFT_1024762 [Armillaria solidipes]|uniref:Uncharacterized protein n=1 Tax=Armillaria solidipes TaxID=1076256 RepID=A0A2H3B6A6_9AGAR|nr:hypothetical protein ARMSODRAFT_1024762 [Armillaria solidipes]